MPSAQKSVRQATRDLIAALMSGRLPQDRLSQASVRVKGEAQVSPQLCTLARRAAAEGCVLLENDGILPLSAGTNVAVFGRHQLDWVYMGHGSGGNVNPPYLTDLIDGLDDVGAKYDHVLAEMYRSWCSDHRHTLGSSVWGRWPQSLPEMPVSAQLAQAAAMSAHTAILVIGRASGESQDLKPAAGGYFLTDEERDLVDTVTEAFDNVVVVLNVCNVIDLAWVKDYESIRAVLLAWPGGMEAGNAVADVLYGRVCPSGRLTSAIAHNLDEHPSSATFGATDTQEYTEGVFLGYRHLSTYRPFDIRYNLGHGLSYTTFSIETLLCKRSGPDVRAIVRVTNTGTLRGRDAVILWCEPPRGVIDKPLLLVAGFAKTTELDPGQSENLELIVPLEDLAVFDEERRSYVLEQGAYRFKTNDTFVGKGVLDEDLVFGELPPICSTNVDLRARIKEHLLEMRELPDRPEERIAFEDVLEGRESLDSLVSQLSPAELEALTRGAGTMNCPLGAPGNAGVFGGVTHDLRRRGIPTLTCADGPSGARLERPCSLIPCATALASTWDTQLVNDLYTLVGREASDASVDILLAPGMNLQRSPLCGRNFEYFSEDPIVCGNMAAAVVRGLRNAGVEACPKHFACNNQEHMRSTLDVCIDERTLREAYLRPFAICVREARPQLIMTSYNKINGVWSHYNYDLVTTVLREEWGFEGVVLTDWWMQRSRSPEFPALRDNAYRVRAGVDVLMPGNMGHLARGYRTHRSLLESLGSPDGITRAELQQTARRVLALLLALKSS